MSITAIVENDTIKLPVRVPDGTKVEVTMTVKTAQSKVLAGTDAARWWREREHWPADERAAFARDLEAARAEMNRPPRAHQWP